MAEVYIITNKVNGKQYVGKTNRITAKRMQEHFSNIYKTETESRPLYRAFKKYGIESFIYEVIETNLSPQEAELKEINMIYELDTFNNGYNATIGGDGKTYKLVNEEEVAYIIDLYVRKNKTLVEIAKIMNSCQETISTRLKENGIRVLTAREKNIKNSVFNDQMFMFDRLGKIVFQGTGLEVVDFLIKNEYTKTTNKDSVRTSILRVLKGTRQTYLKHTFRVK